MSFNKKASKGIALSLVGVSIISPLFNVANAMEHTPNSQEIQNNVFANIEVKILKDNDDEKVVEVIDGDIVSTSTYNKKDNSLRLVIKKDGVIIQDELTKGIKGVQYSNISPRAKVSMGALYSKLKYSINMKSWTLTNSKGNVKKKPETKSYKENLYRFKSSVDACRRDENVAAASLVGFQTSVIAAAITGAVSGGIGSIIAILGSIGAPISAANSLWSASKHTKDADRYFAIL
ncbi:geobacillin-26 family protein [Romboutsia sp. 1001713B170131_170501_G6]|uniref:geobacillin-26 family protein n=1 Tax=Romboutsia sp. 1001713B170131_170501_G6 TaxID=2787108 RepID=UPI0018A944DB|nr:geobacillin-26 family protein [Romboutsia sp. 1001713B170131_170501_G6]